MYPVFKRLIKLSCEKPSEKMKCISKCHEDSINIKNECISYITDNLWFVLSASKNVFYEVTKVHDACGLKYSKCNISIHMYLCTCLDSIIRLNICKHIHAVCRVSNSRVNAVCTQYKSPIINFNSMEENVYRLPLPQIIPTNNVEVLQPRILSKLHQLTDFSCQTRFPAQNEDTKQIMRMVDNLISKIEKYNETLNSFNCNENSPAVVRRQKISPQTYFFLHSEEKEKEKLLKCLQ